MNITQHHEPFDFDAFFEDERSKYIGVDTNDFQRLFQNADEVHSFMGSAEWKDRVENGLGKAIASDEAVDIIKKATSAMIVVIHSQAADRPLKMDELQFINEFVSGLPKDIDIVWGVSDDASLGNVVKTILLVGIRK